MPSYEESKKEVEKFMGQGQSQFVSLKELIEELQEQLSAAIDKIQELESEIERLKNFIRSEAYSQTINPDSISGAEVFNVLEKWANGE